VSFWSNIATYSGPTTFGVRLIDKLAFEQGGGGWVAGLEMNTYKVGDIYALTNKTYSGSAVEETVNVYFLSWKVDDVTKVSFESLKGFDYFVTSEFSGCRFVVTDFGVAHVAWSAGGERAKGIGSQALRDQAEYNALSYGSHQPQYRRRLSMSLGPGKLDTFLASNGSNTSGQSYNDERALVFGYRVSGGWAFKVLRYKASEGSTKGVWSNFACVWAS
jgi:hypothetical protein